MVSRLLSTPWHEVDPQQPRVSHENGAVESQHGHIKKRISQALLLRESNDFDSVDDYLQWLDGLVQRFNRRCGEASADA